MISYYISKSHVPYINQSIEEILTNNVKSDEVIFYLWQNDNTVVIGQNQNAWREVRLEAFNEDNGSLMRRITGGGAVYQDLGNQIFTFIAPPHLYDLDKQIEVIRKAVSTFGLDAQKIGRNDILIDGKKFSGNAFRKTKHANVQHGTLLVNTDMSKLVNFLNPSKEKLESKGVTSVRSRVVNLAELNPEITIEKLQVELLKAFKEVYNQELHEIKDSDIDQEELTDLVEYYSSDDWKLGPVSPFNYETKNRFSFGEIIFNLEVNNGIVESATVYSDALDSDWILKIQDSLKGITFNKESIIQAIPDCENLKDKEELIEYIKNDITL